MALFGVPVQLEEIQSDLGSPDRATEQTVAAMLENINRSVEQPAVQMAAHEAARRWRGGPLFTGDPNSPAGIAGSCWWAVKDAIRFVHHQKLSRDWLNRPDELQLLIPPDALVTMTAPEGDCAVFTMAICAFLKCLGVRFEVATAAVDPEDLTLFSHVWPRAIMPDGSRISLDASHGKYPGWQVPARDIFRLQVWDESGNPVPDRGAKFMGLHGYQARGLGAGLTYDPATGSYSDESGTLEGDYLPPSGGSSLGADITGAISSFSKAIAPAIGQLIAPTTQIVRNANGSYSLITPGSSAAASSLLASTTGAGGSNLLLIGGGILALVLVMAMMSKR